MKKKFWEFFKFAFIGGSMTILNLILFWVFNELCHFNYLIANVVSYSIPVVISYFLNSFITFKQKNVSQKDHVVNLISYFTMKLILLGMDSICLYLMVQWLNINKYISKIFLTLAFLLISYPLTKIIVERKKK